LVHLFFGSSSVRSRHVAKNSRDKESNARFTEMNPKDSIWESESSATEDNQTEELVQQLQQVSIISLVI